MEKPLNAPACFAAASVFSHDSNVCRGCPAFEACAASALETLQQIRHIINVDDILKRHARAKHLAREAILAADKKAAEEAPPGNNQKPLATVPVTRQTQVVQATFELSADEERVIATLPIKPQKVAVSICKSGMLQRIKVGLADGRNALTESGPQWLRVALTHLLAGGFAKSDLRASLSNELGWNDATAASYVSMTVALLKAFNVVQETEGRVVLVPASAA